MKCSVSLLGFLLAILSFSIQAELPPNLSSDEIIEKLSQPKKHKPKLRSIRMRSLSAAPKKKVEMRALSRVRYAKDDIESQPIEEIIYVPNNQANPHVNLNIEFDSNSYQIRASSHAALHALGKALQHPDLSHKQFFINGHTDSEGSKRDNLKLSLKRALAVRYFLEINHNIDKQRLKLSGYGEGRPLVENSSGYNKQLNRRVEIVLQ